MGETEMLHKQTMMHKHVNLLNGDSYLLIPCSWGCGANRVSGSVVLSNWSFKLFFKENTVFGDMKEARVDLFPFGGGGVLLHLTLLITVYCNSKQLKLINICVQKMPFTLDRPMFTFTHLFLLTRLNPSSVNGYVLFSFFSGYIFTSLLKDKQWSITGSRVYFDLIILQTLWRKWKQTHPSTL